MGMKIVLSCADDKVEEHYRQGFEDLFTSKLRILISEFQTLMASEAFVQEHYQFIQNELTGIRTVLSDDEGNPMLLIPKIEIVED